jgi:cytochrome c2
MRKFLTLLPLCLPLHAEDPLLTFDNQPMGSIERPLVLRSYLPDPDLEDAVFPQHDTARKVSKYNPSIGGDVKGEIQPVPGLAAAIGVNFGPSLSFVFDTTECRLMYAWQGGFVDMTPYWGDVEKGSRVSFDYVPRLVGTMFFKASGKDPIELGGKSISDLGPRVFTGYQLENGVPVFAFKAGETSLTLSIKPSQTPLSFDLKLTARPGATIHWRDRPGAGGHGTYSATITGTELAKFQGYQRDNKITKASASAGETLFNQYGCAACHSIDGSKSHGPSVGQLAGHKVEIEGLDQPVVADRAYLLESIKNPNAKIVKGYPPNYMPPFGLPEVEYESLILYIQSLDKPE